MATHSSILASEIPRTEDYPTDSPWDRKELDTTERLNNSKRSQQWCLPCAVQSSHSVMSDSL